MALLTKIEQDLVAAGYAPLSLAPELGDVHQALVAGWQAGKHRSLTAVRKSVTSLAAPASIQPRREHVCELPVQQPVISRTEPHARGDRLNFVLPDFTRVTWVSDRAREIWEPRVKRIRIAWRRLEWISVAEGIRRCALSRVKPGELPEYSWEVAKHGLSVIPLGREGAASQAYSATPVRFSPKHAFLYVVATGPIGDASHFRDAWTGNDNESIGELLGFPACCRSFYERVWVQERRVDTTWPMALATGTAISKQNGSTIEYRGGSLSTPLFRWLGVRLVPHLACRFDCPPSEKLAERLLLLGRQLGYGEEMDWAETILRWDVEWDALHAIAEIRTPIAKVVTRTDATGHRRVVRVHGTASPPSERGSGLPFRILVLRSA